MGHWLERAVNHASHTWKRGTSETTLEYGLQAAIPSREQQQDLNQLASPATTSSEPDLDQPATKRRKVSHTEVQQHSEESLAHEAVILSDAKDEGSGLSMSMSYAAARKLDNYPTSTNPVAIALWVIQKLDHAGRAARETRYPESSRRSSTAFSNPYTPYTECPGDEPKTLGEKKAYKASMVNERKRRQRQDNWVKNKENDVVARIKHNARQGGLRSRGKGRGKGRKSARKRDEDGNLEDEDNVSAKIKASMDSLMASKKKQLAPDLCKLSPFRLDGSRTLDLEEGSLSAKVVDTAYLFASILPVLAEKGDSHDFQRTADGLVNRLQMVEDSTDDLVHGLEVLMENHEVESGVHKVMCALYPDRSSCDRIGKGSRKDRNLAISLRGASFDSSNSDADDQQSRLDDMASNGAVRTSGRTRKSTARFDEAITELKSKRAPRMSNSPIAVSPSQPVNSKRLILKIKNNGSRSVSQSPVQVGTPQSDFVPSRSPSKRCGNKIKTTGTFPPTNSKLANKGSFEATPKTNGTSNHEPSKKPTSAVPVILISRDSQEMPQSHLHRPDLVKNLLDAVDAIMLEDLSSDDSGSESELDHQEIDGRVLTASHPAITQRSPKDLSMICPAEGDLTPIGQAADGYENVASRTISDHLVDGSDLIDEGKAAFDFYAELAHEWKIPQASPKMAGLPYPEFLRPMTDKDGWTSTGILNEFGEEIVHVDGCKWDIYLPQASHGCHIGDEIQVRLKSKSQIAEDEIYGFPPQPKKLEQEQNHAKIFKTEDVAFEIALYQTRKTMEARHLHYDRSMSLSEMKDKIEDYDRSVIESSRDLDGNDKMVLDEDGIPHALNSIRSTIDDDRFQSNENPSQHTKLPSSFNLHSNSASMSEPPINTKKARVYPIGYPLCDSAAPTPSRPESNSTIPPRFQSAPAQASLTPAPVSTPSAFSASPVVVSSATSPAADSSNTSVVTPVSRPAAPSAPPYAGPSLTPSTGPPSTPSTAIPTSDSTPPYTQALPMHHPAPPILHRPYVLPRTFLPRPWRFNNPNSAPPFNLPSQSFNPHQAAQNNPYSNGGMPYNQPQSNGSPPPLGQDFIFLDPNDPHKGPVRHPQSTAINGGPPGGGHVINPPRKSEPTGYKKKIGPDFKMDLVNGRLSKPGSKPQPKPKRGGNVIDFTGV